MASAIYRYFYDNLIKQIKILKQTDPSAMAVDRAVRAFEAKHSEINMIDPWIALTFVLQNDELHRVCTKLLDKLPKPQSKVAVENEAIRLAPYFLREIVETAMVVQMINLSAAKLYYQVFADNKAMRAHVSKYNVGWEPDRYEIKIVARDCHCDYLYIYIGLATPGSDELYTLYKCDSDLVKRNISVSFSPQFGWGIASVAGTTAGEYIKKFTFEVE